MSRMSQFLFGAGGFAMHASNFLIVTWLTKFYTPGNGKDLVDPWLFGLIFLFGRIIDAVADPVVGYWSDHHEGKLGRRIPFIRWGAPFLALFLFLSFTPITKTASLANGIYLAVIMAGVFFFYTVVITPYLALIPEITNDPKERVNLTTIQAVFILIATVYVAALSGPLIQALGYVYFMLLSSLLVLAASLAPLWAAKPQPYTRPKGKEEATIGQIVKWTLSTWNNRPFRHVLLSTSFFWFGLNLLMAAIALWVTNVLGGKEADVALVMGPLIVSNLLGFWLFNILARRRGKYFAFILMFIGMILVTPSWFFVQRLTGDMPYLHAMIMSFCLGFPLAGFQSLPYAVLADVIDHDEELSGERREAIFFGMQAIFQKSMIGLSMVVLQLMRSSFGEVMGLRLLGPVAAISCLIGLISFLGYSLRELPENPSTTEAS